MSCVDEMFAMYKRGYPDGVDSDGPFWFLPNDRKTHDFSEWYEVHRQYLRSLEQLRKK